MNDKYKELFKLFGVDELLKECEQLEEKFSPLERKLLNMILSDLIRDISLFGKEKCSDVVDVLHKHLEVMRKIATSDVPKEAVATVFKKFFLPEDDISR